MDLSKEYPGGWVSHVNSLMWPTSYAEQDPLPKEEMDRQRAIEQRAYEANLKRIEGRAYL